jgi:hypothetical protein
LCSPRRHCRAFGFPRFSFHASTFLLPFAPRALPRFIATTRALTPLAVSRREGSPWFRYSAFPPFHPYLPDCSPPSLLHTTPQLGGPPRSREVWASPFVRRLARQSGQIGFVSLWTGSSSPPAPHPASDPGPRGSGPCTTQLDSTMGRRVSTQGGLSPP